MRRLRPFLWLLGLAVVFGGGVLGWRHLVAEYEVPAESPAVARPLANVASASATAGGLVVRTKPSNAVVSIAGQGPQFGPAANFKDLKPGRLAVTATADGYLPWRGEIDIQAAAVAQLDATLERAYGELQLDVRPANLGFSLSGRDFSTEGIVSNRPVRVPAGRYTVTIFGDGKLGVIREFPVDVKAGDTARAVADVQPDIDRILAPAVDKAILNNMRQLAAASDQFFLENGVSTVSRQSLVGPTSYIKALNQVANEAYPSHFTQAVTLTVSGVAGARTITYAP